MHSNESFMPGSVEREMIDANKTLSDEDAPYCEIEHILRSLHLGKTVFTLDQLRYAAKYCSPTEEEKKWRKGVARD